jgi:tetratricopeptide (TPR) repeat protein
MTSRVIFGLILYVLHLTMHSQNRELDSLKTILRTSEGNARVDALLAISMYYNDQGDRDLVPQSLEFARQANKLAIEKSYTKGISRSYHLLGASYMTDRKHDTAISLYSRGVMALNRARKNIWGKYDQFILPYEDPESMKILGDLSASTAKAYGYKSNISKGVEYLLLALGYFDTGLDTCISRFCSNMKKNGINAERDKFSITAAMNYVKEHPEDNENAEIGKLAGELFASMRWASLKIGDFYISIKDYDQALVYLKKAERNAEEVGAKLSHLAILKSIADTYEETGEVDSALTYYKKLFRRSGELNAYGYHITSVKSLGQLYKVRKKWLEALNYYRKVEELLEPLNDGTFSNKILYKNFKKEDARYIYLAQTALNLTSIGDIYLLTNKKTEALENYKKAISIFEGLLPDSQKGGYYPYKSGLWELGKLYSKTGDYQKSVSFLERALVAHEKGDDREELLGLYEDLYKTFDKKKDIANAYKFHRKHVELKDSIFNEKNANEIKEIQKRFAVEKKDNEIDLLNKTSEAKEAEIEKQKLFRNSVVVGLLFVVLLGLFAFRGYIQKRKANTLLEYQKQEIENQKHLVEEKQKEIIDSIKYAKRIQTALLTNEKYISKNLGKR